MPRLRLIRNRCRTFGGDRRGAVLIEFGFIVPVVLALLLGIFDVSLAYFTQIGIEHSVSESARVVRVGFITEALDTANDTNNGVNNDADPSNDVSLDSLLRDVFCANAPLVLNCEDKTGSDQRVGVCILSNPDLAQLNVEIANANLGPTTSESSACSDSSSAANDFVAIIVNYRHTYFTPFLGMLLPNDGTPSSNEIILSYTYVYRNEPSA